MHPDQFTNEAPGTILDISPHPCNFAYDPFDLPPEVDLGLDIFRLNEQAALALGGLNDAVIGLPNPRLVVNTILRSEAIASSRMEGTVSSLEQLALFNAGSKNLTDLRATQEVDNYFQALTHGIELLESIPPSMRMLKEIHGRLLSDARGSNHLVSDFRAHQNLIVNDVSDLPEQARFVPPPVQQMNSRLNSFERYLNGSDREYPSLIELALIHYQFETIHPFEDGNGRIGRLLISLLLSHWGVLKEPVLRLSPYFEQRKTEYVDALLAVSTRGEWIPWIRLFLTAIRDQSLDSAVRARALFELREKYRARVIARVKSTYALDIVDGLFDLYAVSAPIAMGRLGMTQRTARRLIAELVDADIVVEVTGQRRNRLFYAPEIFRVLRTPIESFDN
jgi:Fic family protein